jgi:SAM-dependent methyltransferase
MNHDAYADDLDQSWSANASAWVAAVRGGRIESRRLATDRLIVEAILARRPRRMLDLGCGEGWLVRALAPHGVEGVGLDGSPALVEAARTAGGGGFQVCTYADLVADPGRIDGRFDVISANFALLSEDLVPLLEALRGKLADGGALVIQTVHPWTTGGPYVDGWRVEDFGGFGGAWHPMPWYFRTLESWFGLLDASGYVLAGLTEARHPQTRVPLSLLLVAEPAKASQAIDGAVGQDAR